MWTKKAYNLCRRSSSWCTKSTLDKVMTTRFVWKQWTLMTKSATSSLNCKVTPNLRPYNTLLPLHPLLINMLTSSFNLKPPYSTKHFNIKEKMLSNVVDVPIVCTQRRIKILFHSWTMYRWIKSHWVLSIVITSSTKTTMKETTTKVLVESKRMSYITFAIPLATPISPMLTINKLNL